jgi:hypothetical protein
MVDEKKKELNLLVKTGTVVGSTYSQIARVTVSDNEITIEFAYVHPADPTQGQSVARVTMPIKSGISLAETILQTRQMHEKRKEGKRND